MNFYLQSWIKDLGQTVAKKSITGMYHYVMLTVVDYITACSHDTITMMMIDLCMPSDWLTTEYGSCVAMNTCGRRWQRQDESVQSPGLLFWLCVVVHAWLTSANVVQLLQKLTF